MVDDGLLVRVDDVRGGRTRKGYAATEAAAEPLPVLQQSVIWGEHHTAMPNGGAHRAMVHEACGDETIQGQICSSCGG
ncbi:hypothetical protein [Streptosporangium sandarakinum]|uniref:hypothetical protein n=1 Tax=Streptosporangium sandarakinum TaxID=1260955 RepID=UPI0033A85AB6